MRLTQLPLFVFACLAVGCGRANVVAAEVEAAQAYTEPPEPPRPPYTDICVRAQASRIPVLMFHDVTATRGHDSVWFDVTVDEFKAMVDRFVEDRIQPISLEQLYAHLTRGAPVPEKAIVLTFDDNYQGVYDHALPILKAANFPAAVFVHTNYVGSHDNRPKMDWPTLKELVEGGLITIGSHTLSHPDDITQIPPSQQEREIVDSKRILEEHLGKTIDTFAYPDGKNDSATQSIVRQAGYKMAFTMANGPAEESPNIVAINRYIHTRLDRALDDSSFAKTGAPAAVVEMSLQDAPITYESGVFAEVRLALIKGGLPSTRRSTGRQGVLEFVKESGASAGVNGTFFAMAAIQGTSNEMVGPCFASNEQRWVADSVPERLKKIVNRPMVVWGPRRFAIFPFQGGQMNGEEPIRDFMPDFTDAFVTGAWIVHQGIARTRDELEAFSARDMKDPRHRSFFGVMPDGTAVAGASLESVGTPKLAEAAAAAGVREAVMMDSGFSTSLVYGDKVLASGHSTPTMPSRPVPHAIVLRGTLAQDPATIAIPQPEPERPRRKRRTKPVLAPDSSPSAAPPPDVPTPPDDASSTSTP